MSNFVKCFATCVSLVDCQKAIENHIFISEEILRLRSKGHFLTIESKYFTFSKRTNKVLNFLSTLSYFIYIYNGSDFKFVKVHYNHSTRH